MDPLRPDDPESIGPYRLAGRLGRGGMGDVFLARSPGGRTVAVKLIRRNFASDPQFRRRFAREIAAAKLVGGYFTAQVVDADTEADPPWMATAFIDGPSLADAVRIRGPLPFDEVRTLGAGLAEGLAAIHSCRLVHRDLKPGNVILAADGPRIIDFGVVRGIDTSTLTEVGRTVGTLAYMSPEHARGQDVEAPGDVFSLGSVLTFAATGHGPFGSGSTAVVLHRIALEGPDLSGVPEPLRAVIARCLEKNPYNRPTVRELIADLMALRTPDAAPPATAPAPPPVDPRSTSPLTAPGPFTPPPAPAPPPEPRPADPQPQPQPSQPVAAPRPAPAPERFAQHGPFAPASAPPLAPSADGGDQRPPSHPSFPSQSAYPFPPAAPPGERSVTRRRALLGGLGAAVTAGAGAGAYLLWGRDGTPHTKKKPGHRDPNVLAGHTGAVTALVFTPDGKYLASASRDGTVRLWDLHSRRTAAVLRGHSGPVTALAGDPAGSYLASGGTDRTVRLWRLAGRTQQAALRGHTGAVTALAFSPDGSRLASGSADRSTRIWRMSDHASARTLTGPESPVTGAVFSPDGGMLLVAFASATLQFWVAATGEDNGQVRLKSGETITSVAIAQDSTIAMGRKPGGVTLWDGNKPHELKPELSTAAAVESVVFGAGGSTLATALADGTVRRWGLTTHQQQGKPLTGHRGAVTALAWSPDGSLLAGGGTDRTIRLWPA